MNMLGIAVTVMLAATIGRAIAGKATDAQAGCAMVAAILGALVLDSVFPLLWPRPWNWNVVPILAGAIAGAWLYLLLIRAGPKRP